MDKYALHIQDRARAGEAQFQLGVYYFAAGDSLTAIDWYKKAAAQGHKIARERLAELEHLHVNVDEGPADEGVVEAGEPTVGSEPPRPKNFLVYCRNCRSVSTKSADMTPRNCSRCQGLAPALELPETPAPRVAFDYDFEGLIPNLSGRGFEQLLAAIFRALGFEIEETPVTGDFGVDLILIDPRGERVAVQAKRHKADIGISAVQEIYYGMTHHGCSRGILAIATDLTPAASLALEKLPSISLLSGRQIGQLARQFLGDVLVLTLESRGNSEV